MNRYDFLADLYDVFFQAGTLLHGNKAKMRLLDFFGGREIALDVGCGTGSVSVRVAGRARKVIGLDYSRGMLNIARRRARKMRLSNVEFIQGDAFKLPFESCSFDFVFTSFFFCEFSPEQAEMIMSEMVRVLKTGGRLGIVDEANSGRNLIHAVHSLSHRLLGQSISPPHDYPSLFSRHSIRMLDEKHICLDFLTALVGEKRPKLL